MIQLFQTGHYMENTKKRSRAAPFFVLLKTVRSVLTQIPLAVYIVDVELAKGGV